MLRRVIFLGLPGSSHVPVACCCDSLVSAARNVSAATCCNNSDRLAMVSGFWSKRVFTYARYLNKTLPDMDDRINFFKQTTGINKGAETWTTSTLIHAPSATHVLGFTSRDAKQQESKD